MENLKEPEKRSCAVCATPLHVMVREGKEPYWVHSDLGYDNDHPPVPVEPDEVHPQLHCDFCFKANPPWVLPSKPFASGDAVTPMGVFENVSGSNFAACDECARLIRAGRWDSVVRRVVRSVEERHGMDLSGDVGRAVREQLREFYALLRQNVTGPLRPLGKDGQ